MKAIIKLDVPDWQIGKEVSVYFPDTMQKHGICEEDKTDIVLCKDCKYGKPVKNIKGQDRFMCENDPEQWWHYKPDWYCADGERKTDDA